MLNVRSLPCFETTYFLVIATGHGDFYVNVIDFNMRIALGSLPSVKATLLFFSVLQVLKSPALSSYEKEAAKYTKANEAEPERPKEAKTLMDIMYKFSETEHQDRYGIRWKDFYNEYSSCT